MSHIKEKSDDESSVKNDLNIDQSICKREQLEQIIAGAKNALRQELDKNSEKFINISKEVSILEKELEANILETMSSSSCKREQIFEAYNDEPNFDLMYNRFLQKGIHFCFQNYQKVTMENFSHVLTIYKSEFLNQEHNVLCNAYQMLLLISEYYQASGYDCDPNSDPSRIYNIGLSFYKRTVLNIDINHTIQPDVSLVENIRRFLFYFPENYAFFVFEQGSNDKVDEINEINRTVNDEKDPKCAILKNKLKLLKKHLGSIPMLLDTVEYGVFDNPNDNILFRGKKKLCLGFMRLLYMWIIEMHMLRLNINIEEEHNTITINNKCFPVTKPNPYGSRSENRMRYCDVMKNILEVLDLNIFPDQTYII